MKTLILILIVLLTFAAIASAETVAVCFTDPVSCPPCRELDKTWNRSSVQVTLAQHNIRRVVLDVRREAPASLAAWRVKCWPTTVLVETGERTVELRRFEGALSEAGLVRFLEGGK